MIETRIFNQNRTSRKDTNIRKIEITSRKNISQKNIKKVVVKYNSYNTRNTVRENAGNEDKILELWR